MSLTTYFTVDLLLFLVWFNGAEIASKTRALWCTVNGCKSWGGLLWFLTVHAENIGRPWYCAHLKVLKIAQEKGHAWVQTLGRMLNESLVFLISCKITTVQFGLKRHPEQRIIFDNQWVAYERGMTKHENTTSVRLLKENNWTIRTLLLCFKKAN